MRERALPRTGAVVSEVGLALVPGPRREEGEPISSDELVVVQRAVDRGYRLFDLTLVRTPTAYARRLLTEFGDPPGVKVLVPVHESGIPTGRSPSAGNDRSLRERPTVRSLEAALAGHGARGAVLAELVIGRDGGAADAAELVRLAAEGSIAGWGVVPGPAADSLDALGPLLERGASWIRVPAHLLDPSPLERILPLARRTGSGLFVVDPFAGGRLDGSFLSSHILESTGATGPPVISDLRRSMGPVTRLGFLTAGRRRTLPQAAALYLLRYPEVVSVLIEARSVPRVDELAHLEAIPPLTVEEIGRVGTARRGDPGTA